MKKRLILGACTALFLGAGIATAAHVTQAANRASSMMLENVEALAESEIERCPYANFTRNCPAGDMQITCSSNPVATSCEQRFLDKCPC